MRENKSFYPVDFLVPPLSCKLRDFNSIFIPTVRFSTVAIIPTDWNPILLYLRQTIGACVCMKRRRQITFEDLYKRKINFHLLLVLHISLCFAVKNAGNARTQTHTHSLLPTPDDPSNICRVPTALRRTVCCFI